MDIKEGKFEYEELVAKAELLKSELSELYKQSTLPDFPDLNVINKLLVSVRKGFYIELS